MESGFSLGNINGDQTAVKTLTASMWSTSDMDEASNTLFIADIPAAVIHVKTVNTGVAGQMSGMICQLMRDGLVLSGKHPKLKMNQSSSH